MITFNSTFGMGKTRATLQASGKELIEIKLLRMCVRGEAMISALSLDTLQESDRRQLNSQISW